MKKALLFLGLAALALAGCRRGTATPDDVMNTQILPVRFSVNMNTFTVKATDSALEDGDALGLFAGDPIGAANVRATVSGTSLTPASEIKWIADQTAATTFLAYYPYDAAATSTLAFAVKADQSTYSAYAASDLLTATASAAPRTQVDLVMKHQLSKLVFNVTCEDATDAVASVTLGETVLNANIDLATRTVTPGTGKGAIKAGKAVAANGNKGFVAIVIPQTVQLTLSVVTTSGKTVPFVLDAPKALSAGTSYTADIVVPKTVTPTPGEAVTFGVSIQDWVVGESLTFVDPATVTDPTGKWSVIGLDDWTKDIWMTETSAGVWEADITVTPTSAFKLRQDGKWTTETETHADAGLWGNDDNTSLGVPSVYGLAGRDATVEGLYVGNKDILINYTGQVHLKFTVEGYILEVSAVGEGGDPAPVNPDLGKWSVCGDPGWNTDIWMTETSAGVWEVDIDVTPEYTFKLRQDGKWTTGTETHADAGLWGNDVNTALGVPSTYDLAGRDAYADGALVGNKNISINYTGRVHLKFTAEGYHLEVTAVE